MMSSLLDIQWNPRLKPTQKDSLFIHPIALMLPHCGNTNDKLGESKISRYLPSGKLIVGYANWNQCDDKILEAVTSGVNVVIWFAVNLSSDKQNGLPFIEGGPDMACVADKIEKIRKLNLPTRTTHLISIGGWNAPHPDTSRSALEMYEAWCKWNTEIIIDPLKGFYGFDGFDWDIEGNDDMHSPFNTFTLGTLDLMGEMSQRAKRDGWVVAMAPMESYLDPYTEEFSREVTHAYSEWIELQPNFKYHGRNVYAYLLAKYGETVLPATSRMITGRDGGGGRCGDDGVMRESSWTDPSREQSTQSRSQDTSCAGASEVTVDTFDFITVQLYEGYSHVQYKTQVLRMSPSLVLFDLARRLYDGWTVDFSTDKEMAPLFSSSSSLSSSSSQLTLSQMRRVKVKKTQLVIGLANGWAGDGKFLLLHRDAIADAYNTLLGENLEPRGFAFWNILDEGRVPPKGDFNFSLKLSSQIEDRRLSSCTDVDVVSEGKETEEVCPEYWLARVLNSFLRIRNP